MQTGVRLRSGESIFIAKAPNHGNICNRKNNDFLATLLPALNHCRRVSHNLAAVNSNSKAVAPLTLGAHCEILNGIRAIEVLTGRHFLQHE